MGSQVHDGFWEEVKAARSAALNFQFNLNLHDFGIFLDLEPDEEAKAQLEQNIQVALQSGGIDLEDAIDLRQIRNLKLANQMLKQKRRLKAERDQQAAQANIQAQAEANAKSAEQAALAESQKQQIITQQKIQLEKAKSDFEINKFISLLIE